MRQPTQDELESLQHIAQNVKAMRYLDTIEAEYMKKLVAEKEEAQLRQLQGALLLLRDLKKHINSRTR